MSRATNTRIVLRSATLADVTLIEHWNRQPQVISATTDDQTAKVAFEGVSMADELASQDEYNQYCIAELDGRPIGAMQIIDPLASNVRAHKFYRRLGFKPVGRRRFGDDDCLVHELKREEWSL